MSKPKKINAVTVMKQVAALNQEDTIPNPNPNPMTPMSRSSRSVSIPKTPATVLDPGQRGQPGGLVSYG